jgi:hypothetical protein
VAWTKREFVLQAFAEIGLASYVYELQPEQLQTALNRLDGMLATWNAVGVRLGYPLPSSPSSSDLDQDSSVPDAANEAIYLNLAIRVASSVGKTPSAELKETAKAAYDVLLAQFAFPMERQLPRNFPAGAGNKPWLYEQPFLAPPTDPVTTGGDGPLEFE